jgi:hypothetical protein
MPENALNLQKIPYLYERADSPPAIIGPVVIIRQGERSLLVWLTILPGAFVLFLLLGEFLRPPH